MRTKSIALLLCFVVWFTGCGFKKNKQLAEEKANQLYQTLSRGDIDTVLDFYGEEFYKTVTRAQWKEMLLKIQHKLGNYQSHELQSWRVFTGTGPVGIGTYVTLVYKVKYSKYEAVETLLFKNDHGVLKIISQYINSIGLLSE